MSIQVQHLNKNFNQYAALQEINLDFHDGELVALLGPSGCGKTTLLRIIAGLEQADSGRVIIRGEDASDLHVRERNVGFVFQHYALFRHMTVFENVAFGLRVKPRGLRPDENAIRARVNELLELVQLGHVAGRYPAQLSGGQRQRVALARALAVQPKVLLLDEPFGALDAQVRKELRRWLRDLHDELHVTSLFVTHDQEEALEVADRVVLMNAGRVEQIGTPAEVYEQPASSFVHSFLGSVNLFHGRVAELGLGIDDQLIRGAVPASLTPGSAAVAYVRPHELEIAPAESGEGVPAVIARLLPMGARTRVELRGQSERGLRLYEAEVDKQLARTLQPGQAVRLVARQAQFYPDYQI
ncbi:sulfate/molybdate ABC transporter ATP-binding protein [Aeromonas simiae]|uniref:sulfate/molybdate ABC transporter ATP-binding protein n=1 Tax=Aeromonas simiae TaxID=218936 RepID=UPI00266D8FFE|nr:sulfate ABC transporter ATP-binding protein [Aeromonas simiae]MDO2948674.1 sulfate ABC transporter ATP-binding protein [Aeromonas simiae]MDO2952149.1 sulfate ABC transporter ATP-binding protein [Aeromonas simiae]MDO2956057.1 sulfate ABC transporter ATP-binding protein [Aeromonas simiae]